MRAPLTLLAVLVSLPAAAGPRCTEAPAERWIPAPDMKARITAAAYKVDVFKTTDGNCYEVYGRDREGRRVEIYFDPTTGAVVKETVRR